MVERIVEYDAFYGQAVRDGSLDDWVQEIVDADSGHWIFGTENIITALRLAVKQQRIPHTEITFLYKGQYLRTYPNGGLDPWPRGFADVTEDMLCKML